MSTQFLFTGADEQELCAVKAISSLGIRSPCPQYSVSFLRKWFGEQNSGRKSAVIVSWILGAADFSYLVNLFTQETLLRPFFFFIMFFQSWN